MANNEDPQKALRESALNIFTKQNFFRQTKNLSKAWKGIDPFNAQRATGKLMDPKLWSLEKLQREIERLWTAMDRDERDKRYWSFINGNPDLPEPLNHPSYPITDTNYAIGILREHFVGISDLQAQLGAAPLSPPTRIFTLQHRLPRYVLWDLNGEVPGVFFEHYEPHLAAQYNEWKDRNLHIIFEVMFSALTRPLGARGGSRRKRKSR